MIRGWDDGTMQGEPAGRSKTCGQSDGFRLYGSRLRRALREQALHLLAVFWIVPEGVGGDEYRQRASLAPGVALSVK
jgi:hypothetical protein